MSKPDESSSIMTEKIQAIIDDHKDHEGPLLPILHALQSAFGYIPKFAINQLAETLRISAAEVHGVIGFYHTFRQAPGGKHRVQVCRAEACQAMGSRELEEQVKALLEVDYYETTRDQNITLEPVYCLGNCACSPSVRIDDKIYGRVNGARFEHLVDELQTGVVQVLS